MSKIDDVDREETTQKKLRKVDSEEDALPEAEVASSMEKDEIDEEIDQ
jgi:hypothetical protein